MRTTNPRNGRPIGFAAGTTLLFVFVLLLAGCTHTWSPGQAPPIPLETVGPLGAGHSVELVNNQPNTTPQVFAAVGGHKHVANYNEWTEFFIRYWTEELIKRNVAVTRESPNKILVKLDGFVLTHGFAKVRTNMTIHLSSPDDTWKKTLYETDTSGWSMGRALGSLIYHAVEKMLADPEILARMKPPSRVN
jgi:hypothetical protein